MGQEQPGKQPSILEKIPGGPIQLIIVPVAVAAGLIVGGITGAVIATTVGELGILLIRPKPPSSK